MKEGIQNAKPPASLDTRAEGYAARLRTQQMVKWKRLFDVQAPYRWNLRRLNPGFTLDIGCGLGRNLINLGGQGVGIDHNPHAVEIAKSRGLRAFTPADFRETPYNTPGGFDSILLAHVVEHMTEGEAIAVLRSYIHLLKPQGQVILIAPQERGYRSDPTHVQFMDFESLRNTARRVGLVHVREYSFPFPRVCGRLFRYNEFVSISRKALSPGC